MIITMNPRFINRFVYLQRIICQQSVNHCFGNSMLRRDRGIIQLGDQLWMQFLCSVCYGSFIMKPYFPPLCPVRCRRFRPRPPGTRKARRPMPECSENPPKSFSPMRENTGCLSEASFPYSPAVFGEKGLQADAAFRHWARAFRVPGGPGRKRRQRTKNSPRYCSICRPRNPAADWISFCSTSPMLVLGSLFKSITAPITSPSQMIGLIA